jgi:hypothetical protein
MQNTDAAIAADLPNGDTYTTEVGELLFSLQALLIREAEGGRGGSRRPADRSSRWGHRRDAGVVRGIGDVSGGGPTWSNPR